MFAAMSVERSVGGIVKAQYDLFGITDLTASMWTDLMLPAMEDISGPIMDIESSIMNMPNGLKETVGWGVLFLNWGAKAFSIIAQIILAIGGIKIAFPGIFAGLTKVGASITSLGEIFTGVVSTVGIAVAAITILFVGMYVAWKNNFLGMKKIVSDLWDAVKLIFVGIADFFRGIMNIIRGLITGNFETMVFGIRQLFQGLLTFLVGIFRAIGNLVTAALIGAVTVTFNVVRTIINSIAFAIDKVLKITKAGTFSWRLGDLNSVVGSLGIPSFKDGGIMPYTGLAMLHQGERIIPNGQSSPSINVTYNVTVTDRYEMERLLRENNRNLVEEVKRSISV
jgi:phage-related protein